MTYTVYEAMPLSQMLARVQKYYPGDGYKLVEKAYLFAQESVPQKRGAVFHPSVLCRQHFGGIVP